MYTVMDSVDNAPTNMRGSKTDEHPINWIVFTIANRRDKRQFIRIHPDYIFEENPYNYFKEEDLENFIDAWDFIADGEIEETKLENVKPYVTFIINKVAHLYLDSRENIVDMIQDGDLELVDYYITNN